MDEILSVDKVWLAQALSWAAVALWSVLILMLVPTLVRANGTSVIIRALLAICVVLHIQAVFFLLVSLSINRVSHALVAAGPIYLTRSCSIAAAIILYRLRSAIGARRHVHLPGEENADA